PATCPAPAPTSPGRCNWTRNWGATRSPCRARNLTGNSHEKENQHPLRPVRAAAARDRAWSRSEAADTEANAGSEAGIGSKADHERRRLLPEPRPGPAGLACPARQRPGRAVGVQGSPRSFSEGVEGAGRWTEGTVAGTGEAVGAAAHGGHGAQVA